MNKICKYCQQNYSTKSDKSLFCSDKCRQANYRSLNGSEQRTAGKNFKTDFFNFVAEKRIDAKRNTLHNLICKYCNKEFTRNGCQVSKYCSTACKQASYRNRKASQ